MPSDLSNYLATHYLTADPKPSKKRKRKQAAADSGLLITDDSETGWARNTGGDDDEDNVATVAGTSAEFRKAKKSSWKVVGAPVPAKSQDETSEADAILASARTGEADDEAPAVMMSDGTHAGLQSAAAVSAQLEKRRKQERAEWEKMAGKQDKEAETIYRDATGRRVDAAMKRAEARRQLAEAAEKEERQKDLRGDVQKEEVRRRREELEEVKLMGVARHADDDELNREMKAKTRWGDTMAEYVGRDKNEGGGGAAAAASVGKRLKGRPVYQGAAPPNRYNIRPGYRWDGVDRSNGFEAERFKAMNRVERNKGLEYSWQMDE